MSAPPAPPMPAEVYVRRARLDRVLDGDTVDVFVSPGFDTPTLKIALTVRIRLLHVWCPEANGASTEAGLAAEAYTAGWLAEAQGGMEAGAWPLVIQSEKGETFGRYLGTVWRRVDAKCLNHDIVAHGHGSYDRPPRAAA